MIISVCAPSETSQVQFDQLCPTTREPEQLYVSYQKPGGRSEVRTLSLQESSSLTSTISVCLGVATTRQKRKNCNSKKKNRKKKNFTTQNTSEINSVQKMSISLELVHCFLSRLSFPVPLLNFFSDSAAAFVFPALCVFFSPVGEIFAAHGFVCLI